MTDNKVTQPTEAGQLAAEQALQAIRDRSFSGRHPELGKMINCQICGLRHRENERKCEVHYHKIDGVPQVAGETPATKFDITFEGDIPLKKARQVFGARFFKGKRKRPRNRPQKPLHHWLSILIAAQKRKTKGPDEDAKISG